MGHLGGMHPRLEAILSEHVLHPTAPAIEAPTTEAPAESRACSCAMRVHRAARGALPLQVSHEGRQGRLDS